MSKAWFLIVISLLSLGFIKASHPSFLTDSAMQSSALIPADARNRVCDETCTTTGWIDTGDWKCAFSLACAFNLFDGYFVEQKKETVCVYTCDDGYKNERVYYKRRWVRQGCCSGGMRNLPDPSGAKKDCP